MRQGLAPLDGGDPDVLALGVFSGSPEYEVKPVRTPVAIFWSLGVCIYVPASRHWLISYSYIHLT